MRLDGKTAIVTGAASGIGQGIAEAYAAAGARVVFADLNGAGAEAAAERTRLQGGEAIGIACNVAQAADIERCVQAAVDTFGSVDILFNAAGLHHNKALLDITPESFNRLWNVNVMGLFFMLQACARQMIAQGKGGRIVNVASIAGREGRAGQLEYNATKAAVINLTRSSALELIPHGIGVNAIAPGTIVSGMWSDIQRHHREQDPQMDPEAFNRRTAELVPAKRLGTPADLVGAALLLASPAGDYIIGQTLNIDGGWLMN